MRTLIPSLVLILILTKTLDNDSSIICMMKHG